MQDSRGLRERVMFEDIPSGNEYLLEVLKAMRENRVLAVTYQDYYDKEPREILLEIRTITTRNHVTYCWSPIVCVCSASDGTSLA